MTPNQEVNNLYRTIIEHVVIQWLWTRCGITNLLLHSYPAIWKYLNHILKKYLLQIVSYHDLAKEPEAFFHGLLLGFIANLQETHEIKSNRESGFGRYDILLIPKDSSQLGIVIEFKAAAASLTLLHLKL